MTEMTCSERVFAALRREVPDRVPVYPEEEGLKARFLGEGLSYGALRDLQASVKASMLFYNRFKPDMILTGYRKGWFFLDLGVKCHAPQDAPVTIEESFWPTPESVDVKELPDPRDPKNVNLHKVGKSCELLHKKIGDKIPICGYGGSSVSRAADMYLVEKFLILFYDDPQLAHKILKKVAAWFAEMGKFSIDNGASIIMMSDPTAGGDVISVDHFKEFAMPYEKWCCEEIKKYAKEVPVILHICGETTDRLDLMADTGADGLSLDEIVDLAVAKKKVGDRVCIIGNVPTARVLWLGTPEDVFKASKECIMKAGKGGGFILAPGCEIPPASPFENIDALMSAAKRYGKYPLNL